MVIRLKSLFGCRNAGGRPAALAAVADGTLIEFDVRHEPTNFSHWSDATAIYDIGFKSGFEPWCILARSGWCCDLHMLLSHRI